MGLLLPLLPLPQFIGLPSPDVMDRGIASVSYVGLPPQAVSDAAL